MNENGNDVGINYMERRFKASSPFVEESPISLQNGHNIVLFELIKRKSCLLRIAEEEELEGGG